MNGTEIIFNDTTVIKDNEEGERYGWEAKSFYVEFLCGKNTYTCKGSSHHPNFTKELSFDLQDKRYKCTPGCTNNACTFQIDCPEDKNPKNENDDIKRLEQKINKLETKFHAIENVMWSFKQ
jgi:hypothetical protein